MLSNIKACIFDMDGTIVDSMWVWRQIDIDYLARFGHEVPENMGKDFEGASMREVAVYFKNRFNINDDIDTIINDWNDMAMYQYTHKVSLKPHIYDFLDYLKRNGIKIGLYTSNSLILANASLKAKNIYDFFDVITAGCSGIKGKPEPDGYLLTAEKLDVNPCECLVFEDLTMGIQAGINAGMKTCAVKDKYSDYQDNEKRALADYYIEDYDEVFKNK